MLFSSVSFISLFLPIVCLIYYSVRQNLRGTVLLLASIFFYAWGEPRFLAVMFLSILISYAGALCIAGTERPIPRKICLSAAVLADLSFLVYFKYANFIAYNVGRVFHVRPFFFDVVLPLGISFYTFQALSYLVDVYRKNVPVQKNVCKLALYIMFFPQLIAGPIVKYCEIQDQLDCRGVSFDGVLHGIRRFIFGLSKKVLLANAMGAIADHVFSRPVSSVGTGTAWIGAIAYTFQLYYDFSGYSDMAIGLGSIFGFRFPENFNYPYISRSITEFWRRWHISLSTWFREYLYIPLGGNRVGPLRNYLNLFLVFLATGIWHGASWVFVVWGVWNGVFVIFERATGWHKKEGGLLMSVLHYLYTTLVFVIGWVVFRSNSLKQAFEFLKNMFGFTDHENIAYSAGYYLDNWNILMFFFSFLCAAPIFRNLCSSGKKGGLRNLLVNFWLIVLFLLSYMTIASSTYNPFIYFRF